MEQSRDPRTVSQKVPRERPIKDAALHTQPSRVEETEPGRRHDTDVGEDYTEAACERDCNAHIACQDF